jgi:hypothetical protein
MRTQNRIEVAEALCRHFTGDSSDDTVLGEIPRCADASFLAHYLNGPGADMVMTTPDARWLTVRADDIAQLRTVAELLELCLRHIVVGAGLESVS